MLLFVFFLVLTSTVECAHLVNAPSTQMRVYNKEFVDVVIDDPGQVARLEITFECGKETIVLFDYHQEMFRTGVGRTILVYVGHVAVRLPFVHEPSRKKQQYDIPYQGALCLGRASGLWRLWGKATISPHKMVLGEHDLSVARVSYSPYILIFGPPHAINASGYNYTLAYNPDERYTCIPAQLYHHMHELNLTFDHFHLAFDNDDIQYHLPGGIEHTLVKKCLGSTISLGRPFMHNFAHFYDPVHQTMTIMPSYDQFNYGNARYIYANFMMAVETITVGAWFSVAYSRYRPALTRTEYYIYFLSVVVAVVEPLVFQSHRHLVFLTENFSPFPYYALLLFLVATCAVGACLASNSRKYMGLRRICAESALGITVWFTTLHGSHANLSVPVSFAIGILFAVVRIAQFFAALSIGRPRTLAFSFTVCVYYSIFLVYFVLRPIVVLYFYHLERTFYIVFLLFIVLAVLPAVYVAIHVVWSEIDNSVIRRQAATSVPQARRK